MLYGQVIWMPICSYRTSTRSLFPDCCLQLFPKLHLAAMLIRPLFCLLVSGHNVLRELLVTAFHLLCVMHFRSCPRSSRVVTATCGISRCQGATSSGSYDCDSSPIPLRVAMTSKSSPASASPLLDLYDHIHLPSGCLFPVSVPSDADVTRFLRRDLQAFLSGDIVEIRDIASSKLFTTTSIHYWELIRRFLWRRTIYCKILGGDILNSFEDEVAEGVLCNAIYLDSVLDWIKRPLKAAAKFNPPHRIRLLDIYMLEEFYVGRHEPSALICWQRKNPKTNLRGGDILSKSFST